MFGWGREGPIFICLPDEPALFDVCLMPQPPGGMPESFLVAGAKGRGSQRRQAGRHGEGESRQVSLFLFPSRFASPLPPPPPFSMPHACLLRRVVCLLSAPHARHKVPLHA